MLTIITGLSSFGKSIIIEGLKVKGHKVLNEYVSNIDKGVTGDILEFDKIEQITNNTLWFEEGEEWVVSLVSVLIKKLPLENNYNVIFVERDVNSIIASNENIFSNIITDNVDSIQNELKKAFIEAHVNRVKKWLLQNPNFNSIFIDYDKLVEKPIETMNHIDQKLKQSFSNNKSLSPQRNDEL